MDLIKPQDKLPIKYRDVLIMTQMNTYWVAYYDGDRFVIPEMNDMENWDHISPEFVKYWCELPKMPEE